MDGGPKDQAVIDVLGPLRVKIDSHDVHVGGSKTQALLAVLAHHIGEVVRFDSLAEAVWGDDPPASARNGLQVRVAGLRKTFGPAMDIQTGSTGYSLQKAGVFVDAIEFERLASSADATLRKDPLAAVTMVDDALRLWRGEPVGTTLDIRSLEALLSALTEMRANAQRTRLDALLRLGDHTRACLDAAAIIDEHPFREDFRSRYILALYRNGRQVEALRAFREVRDLLVTELGIEPGPELQRLHRQVLEQDPSLDPEHLPSAQPAVIAPVMQRHNLLTEPNHYVERPETDMVIESLEPGRVVTALGAGGIGKSRCVAAVARRRVESNSYADGVWIVDLAPLPPDSAEIAATVASALRLGQQPHASPSTTVVQYLRGRHALIVLDNCEHVVDATVAFVHRVFAEAQNITILAASRVPLSVATERAITLDRLPLSSARDLLSSRIREAGAGPFTDDEELELCQALDSFPLAIELAASRTRALSPREIVERLPRQPELLQRSGNPAVTLRHYVNLATALEWSIEQLSEGARRTLDRATVFVSDFDLASAEVVLCDESRTATDVIDDLSELVEHNLVNRDHGRGRYRILEPIRQHLRVNDESAQRAYTQHYAAFAVEAARGIRGPDEALWWDRTNADLPHLREVVRLAIADGDVELLDRVMAELAVTGLICALTEPGEWAIDALQRLDIEPVDAPGVAVAAAVHYAHHKQTDECNAILDQLEGFVKHPLITSMFFGIRTLNDPGALDWEEWQKEDLSAYGDRALSIYTANLGPTPALEFANEFGNPSIRVQARSFVSARVLTDVYTDEARRNKHELYRVALTSNNPYSIASGQSFMALQHCFDNDPHGASPLAIDMIEGYAKLRSPFWMWHAVEIVAVLLAIARIDPAMSQKLWAAVDASGTIPYARMTRDPDLPAWVSAQLTDAENRQAIAEGALLDMDTAALEARKAAESLAVG